MTILTHTGGVAATNCFLLADETSGEAVLFDAPDHTVAPLLAEIEKRRWCLKGLWLTHGHFDHFADHALVKAKFPGAQCLIHELDEEKARHPELQTRLFGLPFQIPPLAADGQVKDGQVLEVGGLSVQVIHTSGHSPGHVCYYLPAEQVLIGGDLIIGGSVGRTDLPESVHEDLEASIRKIMELPPSTRLLGGHGPASTLERERRSNPWVQAALEATTT